MFAVLDIEATGGKHGTEGIIDISIYKFDGEKVIDQFGSMVNPERGIDAFVQKLTGITDKMVLRAPKFYELAKRVLEITENCILVGHDVQFDYRMLRQEFKSLGYDYKRETLDTLKISQTIFPEIESHSLGKLCKSLGIPISSRHTAEGDTRATLELFKVLLKKDIDKKIIQSFAKSDSKTNQHVKKLLKLQQDLPRKIGVYYFHNEEGKLIYIGKSNNIARRINQHFTAVDIKSRRMQSQIAKVTFELTGSEAIALLKEMQEIQTNKPVFNRAMRNDSFPYGLFVEKNENGFKVLKINKIIDLTDAPFLVFKSLKSAKNTLQKFSRENHLCDKLNGLQKTDGACFAREIEECFGACINEETAESYNHRVKELIEKLKLPADNFILTTNGREDQESGFIRIQNNKLSGYGFFKFYNQLENQEILNQLEIKVKDNPYSRAIVNNFIQKKHYKKIIINDKN